MDKHKFSALISLFLLLVSVSVFAGDRMRFTSQLMLRYERQTFTQIPLPRDAVNRYRLRWRPGLLFLPHPDLELAIEGEANVIEESDEDVPAPRSPEFHTPVFDRDNFKRDDVVLSRAYLRYTPVPQLDLRAGKFENPFLVTEMLWDNDLHPNGVALQTEYVSADEKIRLTGRIADYYASHYQDDRTNVFAVQGGVQTRLGNATVTFATAYYDYDVKELPVFLFRTNTRSDPTLINDYNLLDLIGRVRFNFSIPLVVQLDHVHNTAAPDTSMPLVNAVRLNRLRSPNSPKATTDHTIPTGRGNDGILAEILIGKLDVARDFRIGYGFHRVESDAVLAAYSTDDWWFVTRVKGHRFRFSFMPVQSVLFHFSFLRQTLIDQVGSFSRLQISTEINWP
ncbi:putative porin [bacterium]|nr:putative porin [bacterium]MCI0606276.1 putative porin [bacterium]